MRYLYRTQLINLFLAGTITNCIEKLGQATVTYFLLLDNRFRAASGYLGAEYQEATVGFTYVYSS